LKAIFPEGYANAVQRLRVPSGFLLALVFLWLASPTWLSLLEGLPLSLAGLALRSWAAGHLRKNESLVTSGPYAWTRNPLYLGTALIALGCAVASAQYSIILLALAVFVLVYLPVIEQEERHLLKLFPAYAGYAARVPLLWPKRPAEPQHRPYDAVVWRRNKEWKAWYGFLAVQAFLVVKALIS
jgi:protein-S-isoprenylcysteine O-methyltransferase Ste14